MTDTRIVQRCLTFATLTDARAFRKWLMSLTDAQNAAVDETKNGGMSLDGWVDRGDGTPTYFNVLWLGRVIDPATQTQLTGWHALILVRGVVGNVPQAVRDLVVDRSASPWWPVFG